MAEHALRQAPSRRTPRSSRGRWSYTVNTAAPISTARARARQARRLEPSGALSFRPALSGRAGPAALHADRAQAGAGRAARAARSGRAGAIQRARGDRRRRDAAARVRGGPRGDHLETEEWT